MSECYDAKLCDEKHKRVDARLDLHDKRLNDHADRLDRLEQNEAENRTEIKNLINKMDDFISAIKWGLGVFVTVSIFVIGILIKK
ncbi:hemolysin XhlA family protein [Clostridium tyrobutyricum]|uniref:hemolysin XhlA family protein n=1 Tax=Clostridium tyrobutyricum TaxID=1519 RepID=UPI001C37FAE0|nr:hemolysin XhlA family protein [Clostridium tyrobutyricum]MBV4417073.1 hemolysin XhlA family protein [Clostridium tyrobutyricum]